MLDGALGPYLIAGLIALAFAGAAIAFVYPYIAEDRNKDKRLEGLTSGRNRKNAMLQAGEGQSSRKKSVADTLKEIESRQKAKEKVTLSMQLERAGLETTPRDFHIMSALAGVVASAACFFLTTMPLVGAGVVGFIFAFGLPRFVLSKLVKRRQNKFVAELANAIDVIVRGVKSGLPLNECIQVVAREGTEPLAGEFREVVDQQRLGVPLGECLDKMCDRLPLAEVRFLAIVIAIQQQAGGNLSEALGNLSGVLRDRFMLSMKVKALSAEAKASAMVLASLPPGVMTMVHLTSPDYIEPLFTTTVGRFMVISGALWMLTGVLIMRKMINFKF